MKAPHPDGPTVHRGYSWPGLEKVSQVISSDLDVGEKLRAVTDCKVCDIYLILLTPKSEKNRKMSIDDEMSRKVTKSAANKTTNNPTSGSPPPSSPVSKNS